MAYFGFLTFHMVSFPFRWFSFQWVSKFSQSFLTFLGKKVPPIRSCCLTCSFTCVSHRHMHAHTHPYTHAHMHKLNQICFQVMVYWNGNFFLKLVLSLVLILLWEIGKSSIHHFLFYLPLKANDTLTCCCYSQTG